MIDGLRSGRDLHRHASGPTPRPSRPFYVGVLEAAEMTGNLTAALEEVADYIDRDLEARRKIQSALFYPASSSLRCRSPPS